jgi:DNA-binding ferritin-like protein (Dps family)
MNFPRREEATNKELILTIIEIQGYLSRYGKSHTNWHETLNEVIERLEKAESEENEKLLWLGKNCKDCGNEKCKKLGTLPKGYDCALWQAESEDIRYEA